MSLSISNEIEDAEVPGAVTEYDVNVTVTLTFRSYRSLFLRDSIKKARPFIFGISFLGFILLATGFELLGTVSLLVVIGLISRSWSSASKSALLYSDDGAYLPIAYEFSSEQIVFAGQAGSGVIPRTQVGKWGFTGGCYRIHVAEALDLFVPRSALTKIDASRLETLLDGYVG